MNMEYQSALFYTNIGQLGTLKKSIEWATRIRKFQPLQSTSFSTSDTDTQF